jgi:phosphate transport system permease protein
MVASLAVVLAALVGIVGVVVVNGGRALSWEMVTQAPSGGYYMGGGGGILNAIVGSLILAFGATLLAFVVSVPTATFLQRGFARPGVASAIRTILELLWGIPSIVYGVICFVVMVMLGLGASLLAGIIALTFLEVPLMTRVMDEALATVAEDLKVSAYVVGANRVEAAVQIAWRQALPGLLSAILLAFGRGIGDAASILFTAGFSDQIPNPVTGLLDSAAALPTMIFFLSTSPSAEVRARAYAAAFILLVLVLAISVVSRLLTARASRYIVK